MAKVVVTSPDNRYEVEVELEHVTDAQYATLCRNVLARLASTPRAYDAIRESFLEALETCPEANPSDVWRYVIYRTYLTVKSPESWKRTSGQGLETAFVRFYNPHLLPHGIRMMALSRASIALQEMGILGRVGGSKLDIALLGRCGDDTWRVFGGVHAKASLAERISDDVPCSQAMIEAGYFSPLFTLDMKAMPPGHGDEVNRGELGIPTRAGRASDKRNYFERDGLFSACYSYNLRTPPTPPGMAARSRIHRLNFSDPKPDQFIRDCVDFWAASVDRRCVGPPRRVALEQTLLL